MWKSLIMDSDHLDEHTVVGDRIMDGWNGRAIHLMPFTSGF
jgi:hypothetical protein